MFLGFVTKTHVYLYGSVIHLVL